MKKNFKIVFFITIVIFCFVSVFSITNVNAAYAYSWTVDGERITKGSSNKSGTASWVEDSNYTGGVLTLNNYTGGQLKITNNGTGMGHVFAVKLVGDNKITVKDGVGIVANVPVVFIGDGKLTINAVIPIGGGFIKSNDTLTEIDKANYSEPTTVTFEPSKANSIDNSNAIKEEDKNPDSSEVEETPSNKDTDDNENAKVDSKEDNSFLDSNLFKIMMLSYGAISLIIIIILVVMLVSQRKKYNK